MANQTITSGTATAITTNTFTKSGYSFIGWNTAADATGTSYTDGQSITITAGATLYAQWTNIKVTGLVVNLDTTNPQSLAPDPSTSKTWVNARPGTSVSSQTANGGITRSTANGLTQFNFDGNADYFQYSTVADTRITGAMTVEMWVNPSTLNTGWNILATRWFTNTAGTEANDWHFAMRSDGSGIKLNLYTTGNSDMFGSTTFATGKWVLVGFTLDGSGNLKFYVNGKQDGTTKDAYTTTKASDTTITNGYLKANRVVVFSKVTRFHSCFLITADHTFNAHFETIGFQILISSPHYILLLHKTLNSDLYIIPTVLLRL
jgi:uncharacterized repeat protein (TIGR02543 family)